MEITDNYEDEWNKEMQKLRRLNKVAMALHFLQGSAQLALSFYSEAYRNRQVPVTTLFADWTQEDHKPEFGLLRKFGILRATSYFAFMSAFGHFLCLLRWQTYTNDLREGRQRFRWGEYTLSASLIQTLLFMLWLNYDLIMVSGCFVVTAMCI